MAISLASLRKAIFDWFNAASGAGTVYAAVGGRFYTRGSVPPAHLLTWPYIVMENVYNSPSWTFDHTIENLRVQFSIFTEDDPDGLDVELIATKLRSRFDQAVLTYTGSDYSTMSMLPEAGIGPMPANPGESDKRGMYVQDYILKAQEL